MQFKFPEEPDAGEIYLNKPYTEFEVEDLFDYFYQMFYEQFSYKLPVDYFKNRNTMRWLWKTYPKGGAAELLKWCFHRRGGILDGEPISINWFSQNHKWRIDREFNAMKSAMGKVKASTVKDSNSIGMMTVKDMMRYADSRKKISEQ